ncbi:hypothetical protein DFJ73DRAFT_823439 [Zopfochytrium polystomum]|nr:hypothetical protein DFJ73DRAFT_823439 [Zopfochytrium polystomum]
MQHLTRRGLQGVGATAVAIYPRAAAAIHPLSRPHSRGLSMLRRLKISWRQLKLPWRHEKFVGCDLQGNMYFEDPSRPTSSGLPRRRVEYADGTADPSRYDPNVLDVQWVAWLRRSRPDAPTQQELIEATEQRKRTIALAAELDRKWEARKVELAASAEAEAKALPSNAHPDRPLEPMGQGDTFQPAAWSPTIARKHE